MGKAIPCAFGLLPSKKREAYARMAEIVRQEVDEVPHPPVITIMMDTEKAFIGAFSDEFPEASFTGCDFHYKNCLKKHIAPQGVKKLYNEDPNFIMLVRYMWALAFVPEDKIIPIWETEIKAWVEKHSDDWEPNMVGVQKFLSYFNKTWIGEKNPRTQLRKRPLFAHSLWSKYQTTLDGLLKTNNLVEGYNHAFALSMPARASDWSVIDRLKTEESTSKALLHQAAIGNEDEANRTRTKLRKEKAVLMRNLVSNCTTMTNIAYLNSLITFFE